MSLLDRPEDEVLVPASSRDRGLCVVPPVGLTRDDELFSRLSDDETCPGGLLNGRLSGTDSLGLLSSGPAERPSADGLGNETGAMDEPSSAALGVGSSVDGSGPKGFTMFTVEEFDASVSGV